MYFYMIKDKDDGFNVGDFRAVQGFWRLVAISGV